MHIDDLLAGDIDRELINSINAFNRNGRVFAHHVDLQVVGEWVRLVTGKHTTSFDLYFLGVDDKRRERSLFPFTSPCQILLQALLLRCELHTGFVRLTRFL